MNEATRRRALTYAAKTVLSAAFLAACGGSQSPAQDDPAAASEDDVVAGEDACGDGLRALKKVFPNGDDQWWSSTRKEPKLAGNAAVATCCASMMSNDDVDALAKFRDVGCCAADYSALPPNDSGEPFSVGTACTPWGPPVPPSMSWTLVA